MPNLTAAFLALRALLPPDVRADFLLRPSYIEIKLTRVKNGTVSAIAVYMTWTELESIQFDYARRRLAEAIAKLNRDI